jgi:RNA polymerase sigma-70 factor (ECF subfamily)
MRMDDNQHSAFLDLYSANQRRLYGYIVTLSPNRSDAEEIFSQTTLVLWQKWGDYDPTRNFLAWACGVARLEVLKYRDEPERRWEGLNEDVMDLLSEDRVHLQGMLDRRWQLLLRCMERLKEWQRRLLEICYAGSLSIKEVARRLGKTPNAVSSRLRRLRLALKGCVERGLDSEDEP